MKLSELIEELLNLQEEFDKKDLDPEVMSTSDYGDYCHTEQLNNIESVEHCIPTDSAYSKTGKRFPVEDDDEEIESSKEINEETIIALRYINR